MYNKWYQPESIYNSKGDNLMCCCVLYHIGNTLKAALEKTHQRM